MPALEPVWGSGLVSRCVDWHQFLSVQGSSGMWHMARACFGFLCASPSCAIDTLSFFQWGVVKNKNSVQDLYLDALLVIM